MTRDDHGHGHGHGYGHGHGHGHEANTIDYGCKKEESPHDMKHEREHEHDMNMT